MGPQICPPPCNGAWGLPLQFLWMSMTIEIFGVRGGFSVFLLCLCLLLNGPIHLKRSLILWCETVGNSFLVSTMKFSMSDTWPYCLTHSYHLDTVCVKGTKICFLLNGTNCVLGIGVWLSISPPSHCPQAVYLLTERKNHFLAVSGTIHQEAGS